MNWCDCALYTYVVGWYLNTCNWASKILKLNISYRLLKRDEILEKKLVRPACGESPVWAPEPEYSREALFRGLVCPVKRIASSAMRIEKSQKSIAKKETNLRHNFISFTGTAMTTIGHFLPMFYNMYEMHAEMANQKHFKSWVWIIQNMETQSHFRYVRCTRVLHHARITIGKEIAHAHENAPDNQMIVKRIQVPGLRHHDRSCQWSSFVVIITCDWWLLWWCTCHFFPVWLFQMHFGAAHELFLQYSQLSQNKHKVE